MAYTAVDNAILTSSILREDIPTRWLWIIMMILADQTRETKGVVDCPVDRLAQLANLTEAQTRRAIEKLSSPDEKSRTTEDGGRRIVACETPEGFEVRKWRLVNWQKYKDEIRKAQMAAASRNYRAGKRLREASSNRHQPSSTVIKASSSTPSPSPTLTPSQKEEKTHTGQAASAARVRVPSNGFEKPTMAEVKEYIGRKGLSVDPIAFMAYYESNGWKVGKNPMKLWKPAVWTWERKNRER